MTYVMICPACDREVRAGPESECAQFCECGYSHLDASGQPYTRRNEGEPWQPEPNILVVKEEWVPIEEPAFPKEEEEE